MNRLILCQEKKAKVPYYMDTIGKNIYTIEELCFYFWNYAHLLDSSLLNSHLVTWIRQELNMEELASQTETIIGEEKGVEELAAVVLKSIHYLTESEYNCYIQKLKKIKDMTPFERNKRKADDLVQNKRYYKALQEYSLLLKEPEAEEVEVASKIYHNMGVAYSKMLLFKEGSECFLKAFLTMPGKESMRQYKLALRLCEKNIEEDELVRQFPSSDTMDIQVYQEMQEAIEKDNKKSMKIHQLIQLKNEGKVAMYYINMEETLQEWRDECREYMNLR